MLRTVFSGQLFRHPVNGHPVNGYDHLKYLHDVFRRLANLELLAWIGGISLLFVSDPTHTHFTICPLANLGISWCPGCGLGHSVSYLMHGNIQASLQAHPLGIPALLVLSHRIIQLWNRKLINQNFHLVQSDGGNTTTQDESI